MASASISFKISPGVRSCTDKDGSTILHIEQDKIYSVIGVGSMIWAKLAACGDGLKPADIVEELGAEFKDVARQQIERDVERLFESFRQKGIIQTKRDHNQLVQSIRNSIGAAFIFLARMAAALLLRLRLQALAAFFGLVAINIILKFVGFSAFYNIVKRWPASSNSADLEAEQVVCEAVDRATTWYPKQAMCLQRSAVTACLLRQQGIAAQMVIGCRKMPFKAHAWVEVDGEVVNDKKKVQETYLVLDRC